MGEEAMKCQREELLFHARSGVFHPEEMSDLTSADQGEASILKLLYLICLALCVQVHVHLRVLNGC